MKKKIAFIIPDLYSRGMPRVLENLENEFSKTKYDKYIILLKKKPINFKVEGKIIEIDKEGKSLLEKMYIFIKRLIKIYNVNKKYKFNYIISFGMTSNIIAILTSKYGKIIITEHNVKSIENKIGDSIKLKIYNKIYDFFIKYFYNRADYIVPVSKYIGKDLEKNYKINSFKIYPIYNGVNDKLINKLKNEKLDIKEKKIFSNPTILNVGALSHQKGQWHLLKAMLYLKKYISNIQLVILGDGEYYNKLIKLRNELSLQDCVHFLGVKKNPYKYMENSSVFVLSSLFEGFPNVLVEAMTVGLPIVSVDCKSGPRELLLENVNFSKEINDVLYGEYGVIIPSFKDLYEKENNKIISEEEIIMVKAINTLLKDINLLERYKVLSKQRAKMFTSRNMMLEYEKLLS